MIKEYLEKINSVIENGKYKDTWESLSQYRVPEWYKDSKFGMIKLASTPIIAMTMSSSTSVKPFDVFLVFIKLLGGKFKRFFVLVKLYLYKNFNNSSLLLKEAGAGRRTAHFHGRAASIEEGGRRCRIH